MAIKRVNKLVREEILDENGGRIGEIAFNPDDTALYRKFVDLIERLTTDSKKLKSLEPPDTAAVKEKLDLAEDFEDAAELFESLRETVNIATDCFDEVCKGLDEIFGTGVCELFTQGSRDIELLTPLFDGVKPYFARSRENKVKPYLKDK